MSFIHNYFHVPVHRNDIEPDMRAMTAFSIQYPIVLLLFPPVERAINAPPVPENISDTPLTVLTDSIGNENV